MTLIQRLVCLGCLVASSGCASITATALANLPKLPEDMAYRFADRTLVLMDVDTDLIIDYLPYASRPPKK